MKKFLLRRRATLLFFLLFSISFLNPSGRISAAPIPTLHRAGHLNVNTNVWTPLGPATLNQDPAEPGQGLASGRVTAIAVNPTNSSELWIGAANGGIWHSTDNGQTWVPQTDTQASLAIGSLAIDPNASGTLYAGTGEANITDDAYPGAGILKSTDGGQTWITEGSTEFTGLSIGKIAIDPADSKTVFVAVSSNEQTPSIQLHNTGIWTSIDGGDHWSQVISGAGTDVTFNPQDPTNIYAGVANTPANPTIAGIYKSSDSGINWTRLSSGIPIGKNKSINRVSLGISQDGTTLAALFANGSAIVSKALYLSKTTTISKLGTTWAKDDVSTTLSTDDQWDYDSFLVFDPSDPTNKTLYIGGIHLWKMTNGGTLFTNILPDPGVHVDQHALVFTSPSSFYLGNDGGIWSGQNNGGQITFTDRNDKGLDITQFYSGTISRADPTNCGCAQLYGGAQDNGVDQYAPTQTNTTQWNDVDGGDGGMVVSDYTNNAVVYATFPQQTADDGSILGIIEESTDGGATWNQIINGLNLKESEDFYVPFAMSAIDNTQLYTGTNHMYTYKSVNGVMKWVNISGALGDKTAVTAIAVAATDNNTLYAGDKSGYIFRTTQGGCTTNSCWNTSQPTTSSVNSIAVDPLNPAIVYASYTNSNSTGGQHLYKSTNGGMSWTDISALLPNVPVLSVVVSPVDGSIIAGTSIGAYEGANDGSSWTRLGIGLPNVAVSQVFMDRFGTTLYAATHGRGMWSIPMPVTGSWQPSTAMNPGNYDSLNAVTALSPTNIWVAGGYENDNGGSIGPQQTLLEQWNGTAWAVASSPNPGAQGDELFNITGLPTTGEAWAVGTEIVQDGLDIRPLVEYWNGNTWSVANVPTDGTSLNQLYGVSASSSNDVWAVGLGNKFTSSLMEHWNGTVWATVPKSLLPHGGYQAVSALSPKNVWAAGYDGSGNAIIQHYDGKTWTPFTTDPGNRGSSFVGITAISSRDVWAVGQYNDPNYGAEPFVEHYDGFRWTPIAVPVLSSTQANYVTGITHVPGTDQLWISGTTQSSYSHSFVLHYDGTNWTVSSLPILGIGASVAGVAATTENTVFSVGTSSNPGGTGYTSTFVAQYN